jgi:hypothetical protein
MLFLIRPFRLVAPACHSHRITEWRRRTATKKKDSPSASTAPPDAKRSTRSITTIYSLQLKLIFNISHQLYHQSFYIFTVLLYTKHTKPADLSSSKYGILIFCTEPIHHRPRHLLHPATVRENHKLFLR